MNREDIIEWLTHYKIEHYVLRQDEQIIVDVHGSVDLSHKKFKNHELPVQFGVVDGSFNIGFTNLKTMKGFPIECQSLIMLNVLIEELSNLPFIHQGIMYAHRKQVRPERIAQFYTDKNFPNMAAFQYADLVRFEQAQALKTKFDETLSDKIQSKRNKI